jgi:hypothetical protein
MDGKKQKIKTKDKRRALRATKCMRLSGAIHACAIRQICCILLLIQLAVERSSISGSLFK